MPAEWNNEYLPVGVYWLYGEITADDIRSYLGEMANRFSRGELRATIVVVDELQKPDRRLLKEFSTFMNEKRELLGRCSLGSATVLRSPLIRFLISSLMLVAPFPMPNRAFDRYSDAVAWITQQLAQGGVALPRPLPVSPPFALSFH
jgi:hypothetical protein